MKRGDMPRPFSKRVANPRIREDQSLHEFYLNSDKMHHATYDDAYTQAWFDNSRSVFPQIVGKQVQTLNFLTCQRTSVAFSSTI